MVGGKEREGEREGRKGVRMVGRVRKREGKREEKRMQWCGMVHYESEALTGGIWR